MNTVPLWYPKAKIVTPKLTVMGTYAQGFPRGAVIHYTAGGYGLSELDLARSQGYAYLLVEKNGTVHQGFPLSHWGSHAGASSWEGLGTQGVSRHLLGIEVDCAGLLKADGKGNFVTWYGDFIAQDEVRVVGKNRDNQKAGVYHKYTEEQEAALVELLLWLKRSNPSVFSFDLVLGHDEVSPGRKADPGGALSETMPRFRLLLKALYAAEEKAAAGSPKA